jgi:hypothetical protein
MERADNKTTMRHLAAALKVSNRPATTPSPTTHLLHRRSAGAPTARKNHLSSSRKRILRWDTAIGLQDVVVAAAESP